MNIRRYAVYYAPPAGAFADLANHWLGWDAEQGLAIAQPEWGLPAAEITREPRRYGFHGTIKPPFRLATDQSVEALQGSVQALAASLAPVTLPGLRLKNLDGFLALVPQGDEGPLRDLSSAVVRGLEPFRAPLNEAEIARRRPESLSPRQRELLAEFGYPYVMEEFRFHLTLTDRLAPEIATEAADILQRQFAPVLPQPFAIAELCLFGEDSDSGQFHLLHRAPLSG
ncbi:DUF1045 domain-containing protein [Xinfangfangia sp. CPCC 101601]|uniref:DUF1045 domain-containing protein n=1 Tax=Pseudogemmobacter lacusdianii TaxID=3069608 RepID=A0ABU0W2T6_9RHOB|nr:DUF1045 domain-containing protein [Xinfangfangia sp. CPCC 101601]MDQ2067765.1 DUF1045 domain-containing protein [Xinfangfangia sp. CPCC 101601]